MARLSMVGYEGEHVQCQMYVLQSAPMMRQVLAVVPIPAASLRQRVWSCIAPCPGNTGTSSPTPRQRRPWNEACL